MVVDTIHIRLLPLDPSDKSEVEGRGCRPYLDLAMPPSRTFKQIQLYLFRKWTWLKDLLLSSSSERSLFIYYIDAFEQRSSCLFRTYLNHSVSAILQNALSVSNTVTLVYSFQFESKTSIASGFPLPSLTISPQSIGCKSNIHPSKDDDLPVHSKTSGADHPHLDLSQSGQEPGSSVIEDSLLCVLNSSSATTPTMNSPHHNGSLKSNRECPASVRKLRSPPKHSNHGLPSSNSKCSPSVAASNHDVSTNALMNKEDSLFILLDDFLDTRCDLSHLASSHDHAPNEASHLQVSLERKTLKGGKCRNKKRKRIEKHDESKKKSSQGNSLSKQSSSPRPKNPRNLRRIRPTFLAPLSVHEEFMSTFKKLSTFSKL